MQTMMGTAATPAGDAPDPQGLSRNLSIDCINGTAECPGDEDNPIKYPAVQAMFCILYTTIFVLGVFGNVLVCYVVGRNRAMQTVTNFFITNLALSDILLCILAVPFTPLYSFVGRWVFGQLMCHLVTYAQGTSVYISTLTLTSIAIDRYFVIIYPFQPRMKQSTCLCIIVGIWVFSLLVTLPYGLYMTFRNTYCEEDWPSESFRQIYSGVTTVLQFLVPFKIIAFCYIRVSIRLSDHARLKPGCKSSRKEEADRERKRRTNRMLIAMVTVFGLSWMPLNLINLINDISISIGNWRFYDLVFFCVHAVAMSSTCYNPFLYAWLNDNFRKEFKQVLPCFDRFGLSPPGRATGPTTSHTTAPWRSEAACNGGGAPPRTAGAGGGPTGGGRGRGAGGSEAHDALLPPVATATPTAAPTPAPAPGPVRELQVQVRPSPLSRPGHVRTGARQAYWKSIQGLKRYPIGDTEEHEIDPHTSSKLRAKHKDNSTPSPTTEATWSAMHLSDLVTATYSTEDGCVEFHMPVVSSGSEPECGGGSGSGSGSGAGSQWTAPRVDPPLTPPLAPPEQPLISISPEHAPAPAPPRLLLTSAGTAAAAMGRGATVA